MLTSSSGDLTEEALRETLLGFMAEARVPITFRQTVAIVPPDVAAAIDVFDRFHGRDRRRIKRELRKAASAVKAAQRIRISHG